MRILRRNVMKVNLTRRELLRMGAIGLAALPVSGLTAVCQSGPRVLPKPDGAPYEGTDEQLLDEIERTSFEFFWNEVCPKTGQVKDRALASGGDTRRMSSIAATGFGLTALCIADKRGYRPSKEITERVRTTLKFLANDLENVHGFYYHFIDIETGARWEKVELSSID